MLFTHYLQDLDRCGDPSDSSRFDAVWEALRQALRRELHRRGLWQSSPAYLGIVGRRSWHQQGSDHGALEELLADCYSYIFCQRLRSLQAQRQIKANIDGLVVRNVRNFVHDRQRSHDPIGIKIYEALRDAVEAALASGALSLVTGGPTLRSTTVLACGPDGQTPDDGARDLGPLVRAWNDTLMPELVTARGRERSRVVARLQRCLESLLSAGVRRFRFGEILEPLRYDVRARWAAVLGQAQATGGAEPPWGTLPQAWTPGAGFEARQRFDALVHCVDRRLATGRENERTRVYLDALWRCLRSHALSTGSAAADQSPGQDRLPSSRQLSKLLGIPRERLPGLFAKLRGMVEQCLGPAATPASIPSHTARHAATPARHDRIPRRPALSNITDPRTP